MRSTSSISRRCRANTGTALRAFASMAMASTLLACSASMAQPQSGEGQGGGRNGPPAEALTACKTAKSGDSCSFSAPNGSTVSGSCMAPQSRPLACAPAQGQGSNSSTAPRQ